MACRVLACPRAMVDIGQIELDVRFPCAGAATPVWHSSSGACSVADPVAEADGVHGASGSDDGVDAGVAKDCPRGSGQRGDVGHVPNDKGILRHLRWADQCYSPANAALVVAEKSIWRRALDRVLTTQVPTGPVRS